MSFGPTVAIFSFDRFYNDKRKKLNAVNKFIIGMGYLLYDFLYSCSVLQTNQEEKVKLTLLLPLCDSVAPLVLILCKRLRKANLSGYILVYEELR